MSRSPQPAARPLRAQTAPAGFPAEWLGLATTVAVKAKQVAANQLQRYLARTR